MVKPKDLKYSNASVEIPCLMSNNVNVFTIIKKNKIRSLPVNLFLLTIFTINKVAGIAHHALLIRQSTCNKL